MPPRLVRSAPVSKPDLVVSSANLPASAAMLRTVLAADSDNNLFARAGADIPVWVVLSADGVPELKFLTPHRVIIEAHHVVNPVRWIDGKRVPVTLPKLVAELYLSMGGEYELRPIVGVTAAPLLTADGGIRSVKGYDAASGMWCTNVPDLVVPPQPTKTDAQTALKLLRQTFRTFAFADATTRREGNLAVVDLDQDPGMDESGFHNALLTASARASLHVAPAALFDSAQLSGSGVGKGLLVNSITMIAYGIAPKPFTKGDSWAELDKRLCAAALAAPPCIFLNNLNGVSLHSDTLAQLISDRPSALRPLGTSGFVTAEVVCFIAVTGNALSVSEDLVRRFVTCHLDARMESPEARAFPAGFLASIADRRIELLTAALVIWRWGRQNQGALKRGRPLGGFEAWAEWVRDPLLTLGCKDPVERMDAIKAADPRRATIADIFTAWAAHHGQTAVKADKLAEPVRKLIDPKDQRQAIVSAIRQMIDTRIAGYVLTMQRSVGKWAVADYTLRLAGPCLHCGGSIEAGGLQECSVDGKTIVLHTNCINAWHRSRQSPPQPPEPADEKEGEEDPFTGQDQADNTSSDQPNASNRSRSTATDTSDAAGHCDESSDICRHCGKGAEAGDLRECYVGWLSVWLHDHCVDPWRMTQQRLPRSAPNGPGPPVDTMANDDEASVEQDTKETKSAVDDQHEPDDQRDRDKSRFTQVSKPSNDEHQPVLTEIKTGTGARFGVPYRTRCARCKAVALDASDDLRPYYEHGHKRVWLHPKCAVVVAAEIKKAIATTSNGTRP